MPSDQRAMTGDPGFDPYAVLGVGVDADAIVIQLAYRARIRGVHPDLAGSAGLEQAKRLNAARDWLLDPKLRAQLARSGASPPAGWQAQPGWRTETHAPYGRSNFDPYTFDFGPHTDELRAFLRSISTLSADEAARVSYSLGDTRPLFFEEYRDYFGPQLWARSQALRDAVSRAWGTGLDEEAPFVFPLGQLVPSGFLVANARAQWVLLGDFFREELRDAVFRSEHVIDSFAARCTGPWGASVRQARYGPNEQHVRNFFRSASTLSVESAERLARSWHRHMGRDELGHPSDHIGPGVWLPTPPNYPEVLRVSGFLAAVDASRVEPPAGLDGRHYGGYRYGLRLTAHVLALGLTNGSTRDYLQPWRDAMGLDRSAWSRLRSRVSAG